MQLRTTLAASALAAMSSVAAFGAAGHGSMGEGATAHAVLKNAQGKSVGEAELRQGVDVVLIQVRFDGLPPGRHAFHIHEKGSCEAPDFKSAGGHFNPTKAEHGYFAGKHHHSGDMPNFEVPSSGKIMLEVANPDVTFGKGSGNLMDSDGSAIVVHDGQDDYKSQPSGDAGSRIACGVIEKD
ncbi:MAG: superoxide dismutase family protein [Acidobacteria bacterium]|nr:superoxide dismutase family protein [Acidobacteriota bacterium]